MAMKRTIQTLKRYRLLGGSLVTTTSDVEIMIIVRRWGKATIGGWLLTQVLSDQRNRLYVRTYVYTYVHISTYVHVNK